MCYLNKQSLQYHSKTLDAGSKSTRQADRQTDAKTSFAAAHWRLLFPEVVELLKLKKRLNSSGTAETLFPNEGQNGCKTRLGSVTTHVPRRRLKHKNCKKKKKKKNKKAGKGLLGIPPFIPAPLNLWEMDTESDLSSINVNVN